MLYYITTSWVALTLLLVNTAHSIPVEIHGAQDLSDSAQPAMKTDWKDTLSKDTFHRLQIALQHLSDESDRGQAFRNDTIMRINIEREALRMPLIDLAQAFGLTLPSPRQDSGASLLPKARALESEEVREDMYLRSGTMTMANTKEQDTYASDDAERVREDMYLRSGTMTMAGTNKRDTDTYDAERLREDVYLRSGTMAMASTNKRDTNTNDAEKVREDVYLRSGTMAMVGTDKRDIDAYERLLDRQNLALGAYERVNVARRITGKSELTPQEVLQDGPTGTNFTSNYWQQATAHGQFWNTDQQQHKANFVEGGQSNGFGYIQSTYHKLHCLANIRMILAWHVTGQAEKMSQDMNAHTIHCLEYIRWRELQNPDLNEEPIDTVDYKGMGIH